jgi:hypothetical protein
MDVCKATIEVYKKKYFKNQKAFSCFKRFFCFSKIAGFFDQNFNFSLFFQNLINPFFSKIQKELG